jgi:2-polyprenyl-6-methoxyphenol hydroxylase-like FAD-dependent oxidoreductase
MSRNRLCAGGVAVHLSEGGRVLQAEGDLLVGADGIHSTVRATLYPQEGPPIWNGTMLWRGATRWPVWRDGRTMAIAGGNDAKFVFYAIGKDRDDPDMRLTNWAVMARSRDPRAGRFSIGDWSRPFAALRTAYRSRFLTFAGACESS